MNAFTFTKHNDNLEVVTLMNREKSLTKGAIINM